jgi:hypothetical protein
METSSTLDSGHHQTTIQELEHLEKLKTLFFYFYLCTVHLEDSLIITYQQMH